MNMRLQKLLVFSENEHFGKVLEEELSFICSICHISPDKLDKLSKESDFFDDIYGIIIDIPLEYKDQKHWLYKVKNVLMELQLKKPLIFVLSPTLEADRLIRNAYLKDIITLRKPILIADLLALLKKRLMPKSGKEKFYWYSNLSQQVSPIITAAGLFTLWEAIVLFLHVPRYLFPAPTVILFSILENANQLILAILQSGIAAGMGFLLASTFGIILGGVLGHNRLLESSLFPIFVVIQAIPIIALAPIIVIWFGSGLASKVALSALIGFFPVIVSSASGFKSVPEELHYLMRLYNSTYKQHLLKLSIPHALPEIFAGLRVSAALSVVGTIVAELITTDSGLGRLIIIATYQVDTARAFAAVFGSALLSITLVYLIVFFEKRFLFWRKNTLTI